MREKELRIALVCFGGVSLAVYMHGVTKEILKLVRASSALHAIRDRGRREQASFLDKVDPADREYDTESVYFDLLRDIGRTVDLRVVVDIVAGASAGGINGAMLARALAHDLPMGALRDFWLDRADVGELLAPEARAGVSSKWILRPVLWGLGASGTWRQMGDPEVRAKLSLFMRSRWFKPPLSGARMLEFMHEAMTAMGAPRDAEASLLPAGQKLDLFLTLTDHFGYQQLVRIHHPPLIHEHEHRHVLSFAYQRRPNGDVDSDFDLAGVPALAFAARATASLPGMFPPAQIAEMDRLLAQKGGSWPGRAAFLAHKFASYGRLNINPALAYFVDGSVLNNRPFRQAITAIHGRPAYRQVDRRLLYLDPDPAPPGAAAHHNRPGFFSMLKGALSDLPSTQPVTDELAWIDEFNERVDRLREIVEEARPQVGRLVANIVDDPFDGPLAVTRVRAWREQATIAAARDAGFAYDGYVRLRLASARACAAGLIAGLRGVPPRSPMAQSIAEAVDAWAVLTGRHFDGRERGRTPGEAAKDDLQVPLWAAFLRAFDIDYARRRLHFMVEGQNRLYQMADSPPFAGVDPATIDGLKRAFYDRLDALAGRERRPLADPDIRDLVEQLFPAAPPVGSAEDNHRFAREFAERRRSELDVLMGRLGAAIDLPAAADDIDALLAATDPARWQPPARREVFVGYLGFPFWDVLTFPVMTGRESGEFNRILVDRLSPQDAHSLGRFSGPGSLKGAGFGHFAAFFSRAYRENDYLLGRLHALDRLVDLVCDSARTASGAKAPDPLVWKIRGFTRILDAEEKYLPNSGELIAALRRHVAGLERGTLQPGSSRDLGPHEK